MTAPAAWVGSRQLLRRLRDVMAGEGSAQLRLDRVAQIIARDVVAEVCSIYFRRPGDVLELFATQGLLQQAVHNTRLRVGEGLVGDVAAHARRLTLANAQAHPQFAYRPETGEEVYRSFLGVPILRSGQVLGVLVVQNRTQRNYTEEEIETLETVAMVLAELIAGVDLIRASERVSDSAGALPRRYEGVRLSSGFAMGRAVLHQKRVSLKRMVAEDPEAELDRFASAVGHMHKALDKLLASDALNGDGEHVDIMRAYRMIAEDRGWLGRIREAIRTGLTAEAAVVRIQNDTRARMSAVSDPYLRERLHDLDDLAHRLLTHLSAAGGSEDPPEELPDETVLVARSMGPAELLDYDRSRLRGLLLEEGSATAHVAIIARALDIPAVGQVRNALGRVETGDVVAVDGDHGQVFVRPGEEFRRRFRESISNREREEQMYLAARDLPAVTLDGEEVALYVNAGLLLDLPSLHASGAEGIGLYRTEIPFMVRPDFPQVGAQMRLYAEILDRSQGKPVVFRTLDVGGDKRLPYFPAASEENPAMGWRAIRMALDRPKMLRDQLAAMVQAASGRDLKVMFPMVAEVAEFVAGREILLREVERLEARGGTPPASVAVGAMLEVPSLVFQLPALLQEVAFLSVGTNDLAQFLFASDRNNRSLDGRYDVLSPPMLSLLSEVVAHCADWGTPLSVCGEMAGEPLEAMALVGLGFRSLSMPPRSVGRIRTMIRTLDATAMRAYITSLLMSSAHSIRPHLKAFAQDHGIAI